MAVPETNMRQTRLARLAIISLATVVLSCAFYVALNFQKLAEKFFWDFFVYSGALRAASAGMNPYQPGAIQTFGVPAHFNFTSPPVFIWTMQGLDHWLGSAVLAGGYVALFCVAFFGTIWTQLKLLADGAHGKSMIPYVVAAFAVFNIAGLTSLISGNIGIILNFLVAKGGWYGERKNNWIPLFLAVSIAATLKPFYLEFLILPVFLSADWRRMIAISALCVLFVAGVYALSWNISPDTFLDWRESLADQSITRGDAGSNLFAFVMSSAVFGSNALIAAAVQVGLSCVLLLIVHYGLPCHDERRLAALWVVAIFANPRLMAYDAALAALPVLSLLAGWAAQRFDLPRFASSAFVCASLYSLGVLSPANPLIPRSIVFPLVAVVSIVLACRAARIAGTGRIEAVRLNRNAGPG